MADSAVWLLGRFFTLGSGQNGSVVSLSLARMLELHRAGDISTEGGNSINAVVGRRGRREGRREGRQGGPD